MDAPPPDDLDPYQQPQPLPRKSEEQEDDEDGGSEYEATYRGPQGPSGKPAPEVAQSAHESSMLEKLLSFFLSTLAPPSSGNPQDIRRYWAAISMAIAILYLHVVIACGWMSSLGMSGFARADTVNAMQTEIVDVRLTLYGVAIRDLNRALCNATDWDDRRTLNDQIQVLQTKYQAIAHVPYLLAGCK